MGGFSDILGTIAVDIVGDYSHLQADFEAAAAQAESAGAEISSAFNGAAQQYNQFSDAAQAVIDKQESLNAAVAQSQAVVQELERGFAEGSVSAETLARAQNDLATASERAGLATTATSEAIEVEEGIVGGLLGRLKEIGPELLAGFGMVEFGKSVLEATGNLQKATVALTALTGSGEEAAAMIADLHSMSEDQALSFPSLLEAAQRMEAFGFDTEAIRPALQAAADAAAALNRPLGDVSDALDRIALSGTLSSRQLATIGVSMHDLAQAMGTTDDQAKALFADLDESTRLEVLTTAIENIKNFQGLAEKAASTIPGMTQQIKNAWEDAFLSIGNALSYGIDQLAIFVKSIGQAIDLFARLGHAGAIVWAEMAERAVDAIADWTHLHVLLDPIIAILDKISSGTPGPNVETPAGPPLQVQDTATRVNNLVATFNQDLKTQDWKEAEQIIATLGKLDAPVAQDALQRLVKAQKDAADAARGLGQETDKYKAITGDVTNDLQLTIGAYQRQQAEVKQTAAAIQAYGAHLADLGIILSSIDLPQAYFADLIAKANENMKEAMDSTPPYVNIIHDLAGKEEEAAARGNDWVQFMPKIQSALKQVADGSYDAAKGLDEMIGKVSGPEMSAAQEQLFKIGAALNSGDFRKAEQVIKQLAVNDLPTAIAEYDKLIEAARERGDAEGVILKYQQDQLQEEITQAAQSGQDATAQMIALKNSQVQTQLLIDKSQALGQVYVDLTNIFMNAWQEFANGISDAIVNSKNFGDTMMGVLKKIEQEILNTLIGYVFKQMRDSLLQSSGLLSGITSKISGLMGGGVQGGTMSGPAMLSAMGGGGGGGSAGGGLLGGGGILGPIAAIGTLVSSVIGNFQQAHANKVLGEIELNTRSCFNVLAQMQGSLTGIGPYASLASKMAVSGPAASTVGGGGSSVNFTNCTFSGLTQDMVNALFASALRQFKAAGG